MCRFFCHPLDSPRTEAARRECTREWRKGENCNEGTIHTRIFYFVFPSFYFATFYGVLVFFFFFFVFCLFVFVGDFIFAGLFLFGSGNGLRKIPSVSKRAPYAFPSPTSHRYHVESVRPRRRHNSAAFFRPGESSTFFEIIEIKFAMIMC